MLEGEIFEIVISLALGIGLAAAVGFRVFVPFTFLSVAAMAGMVELSPGWAWIGTYPALLTFGVATVIEILAYYIPWVDNLLDTIAVPVAIVAGAIITASVTTETSPIISWTLAIIVGGGAAGIVQSGTTLIRSLSSIGTFGTGNFAVSTTEWVAATFMSIFALLLPVLAGAAVIGLLVLILRRMRAGRRPAQIST